MKSTMILLFFMMIYPHASFAETFQSSEFLTWSQESKEFYIDVNVGMAGLLAAQNDDQHADCLEAWYWEDKQGSIDFILQSMRDFPAFHPRGVILAILEAQCGSFNYAAR